MKHSSCVLVRKSQYTGVPKIYSDLCINNTRQSEYAKTCFFHHESSVSIRLKKYLTIVASSPQVQCEDNNRKRRGTPNDLLLPSVPYRYEWKKCAMDSDILAY